MNWREFHEELLLPEEDYKLPRYFQVSRDPLIGFCPYKHRRRRQNGVVVRRVSRQTERGPSVGTRRRVLSDGVTCSCGRVATEIGHVIPRLYFKLSGLSIAESYFPENLVAVCRRCNALWCDLEYPDRTIRAKGWTSWELTGWCRRLKDAHAAARDRGIRVYLMPRCEWWPGLPIVRVPRDRTEPVLEVRGYFVPTSWQVRFWVGLQPYGGNLNEHRLRERMLWVADTTITLSSDYLEGQTIVQDRTGAPRTPSS